MKTNALNKPPRPDLRRGIWRLADPKISLASMASIFLGASAARAVGPVPWSWLGMVIAGIFAVEVGLLLGPHPGW
jgi:hypothetical protein